MQNGVQNQPWEGPGATWGVTWGGLGSQVAPGFDFGAILEPNWLQKGGPGGSQNRKKSLKNHSIFSLFFWPCFLSLLERPWALFGSFFRVFWGVFRDMAKIEKIASRVSESTKMDGRGCPKWLKSGVENGSENLIDSYWFWSRFWRSFGSLGGSFWLPKCIKKSWHFLGWFLGAFGSILEQPKILSGRGTPAEGKRGGPGEG